MVAWRVENMGGEIPKADPRLLPDNAAEQAWNVDLTSGPLDGLPAPVLVDEFDAVGPVVKRAFRWPDPDGGDTVQWLSLPSPYSSVVLSPLADDTLKRIYWTNPPDSFAPGAFWTTWDDLYLHNSPYDLGFVAPDPALVIGVAAAGGTAPGTVPYVARSYLFTYVDKFGLESSPSQPSAVVEGATDGSWTVTGLPTTWPVDPAHNYPPPARVRLYRTVSGQNTGATFYRVAEWLIGQVPASFVDATRDTDIVGSLPLESAGWAPPPDGLDGLTALPGGMLVGFTGNTIHFCEPDRPHAWPAAYDLAVQYQIRAFGVWQQSLVVLTEGYPSTGTGTSPANFTLSQVQVPEPCIARGSAVTDMLGVYYASQNGLVMLSYFGMQNQTLATMSKNIWLTSFKANSLIACRHRSQYLALTEDGTGFIIDYSDQRLGIVRTNALDGASCVWNDVFTGDAYICADSKVYRWDDPGAGSLVWRWRSKKFSLPRPVNLGAAQITLDPSVLAPGAASGVLANGDASLVLPAGVNAIFRLLINDGQNVYETALTEERPRLRLPSGFLCFDWQFEIVSRVPVYRVELATTMAELQGV